MRRQLNPAFSGAAKSGGGVSASTTKSTPIQRACDNARTTGRLNLDNQQLTHIPQQVLQLYEPPSDDTSSKWWECAQLTALSLSANELTALDDEIFTAFPTLQTVVVAHNKIARISAQIGALRTLKKLDAAYNEVDALPNTFSQCESLVDVSFAHNALTSLPHDIGSLLQITALNVSHNALTALPPALAQCIALRRLDVSFNALVTLPALQTLTQLETFEAKHNKIEQIPPLNGLTKLVAIDVSENALSALPSLPLYHGASQLSSIIAHSNQLTDINALCPQQDALTETLTVVDVHQNKLTAIPKHIHRFSGIKHLDVSNNDLSDLPSELGRLDGLNKLITDGNPLRSIPRAKLNQPINALKKYLQSRIVVDDTTDGRGGSPADTAFDLTQLQYAIRDATSSHSLSLANFEPKLIALPPQLTDTTNAAIATLTALDISQQRLTDIPIRIEIIKQTLLKLSAAHNCFDRIPLSACSLTHLTELDFSHNNITDTNVPAALAQLTQLNALRLHHNKLHTVPPIIMRLTHLTELDLSFNAISVLDDDITALTMLRALNLNDNRLQRIPNAVFRLVRMEMLNAANNDLNVVPLELALCPALTTLMLTGNPQRLIKPTIMSRGAIAIKQFLRDRIAAGSELERTALALERANERTRITESASPNVTTATPPLSSTTTDVQASNDDASLKSSPSPMTIESVRAAIAEVSFELENNTARLSKTATANLKKKLTLMRLNLSKLEH